MTDCLVDAGAGAPETSCRERRTTALPRGIARLLVLVLSVATTALLGVGAGPAFAVSPVFSTTFGSPGSGAGQLSLASPVGGAAGGVAVDDSTGDVYVADPGNLRVDKFDAAGDFILAFGKDVDQTTGGDICSAASGDTCQAGTYVTRGVGALQSPAFIAVDNSSDPSAGDVYVGDATPGIVSKFTSSGDYIPGSDNDGSAANTPGRTFGTNGAGIHGISVDPDGNLWVYAAVIFEFSQTGTFVQEWDPSFGSDRGHHRDLAVSRDHVFILNGDSRVGRYSRTGLFEGIVSRGDVHASRIALDSATEDLYVSADTAIDHYNVACAPVFAVSDGRSFRAGCTPDDVFGSGGLTESVGIALNDATSTLYVADQGSDRITIFVPPAPAAPVIADEWASSVGSVSAVVDAAINPMRHDASCQLQYADDPSFQSHGFTGSTTVPCDPPDLGSRFADHPVEVDLSGLAPGTIYHYRFLASSSGGSDTGSSRTFATEIPEMSLPDGRVYEQVSPPNKDLGGIRTDNTFQAAVDGNRMAFEAFTSLPGSSSDGKQFLATRGTTGWSTINQIPPQSQDGPLCVLLTAISIHSADLSKGILQSGLDQDSYFQCGKDDPSLVPGEPEGVQNLFLRDNTSGAYQLVSHNPVTGLPGDALIGAADPTLSHVVFSEAAQLTPDAPANVSNLYEWSAGAVKLVSIAPDGTPLPAGASAAGGGVLANHPVSDDGSRIFFQGSDGNLYARVDGASTVQIDAAHGAGPGGGGQFKFASADGSKVFFTDDAAAGLTADTVSGSGSNLYRYDFSTGGLTDLTPVADAGVLGISGGGESGVDLYFVATGDLAGAATAGQPNLYVSHNGALTFIGTLSPNTSSANVPRIICAWLLVSCSRVSDDGSHLAFESDQSLTADDTDGHTEVYLYNRTTAHLVCASCASSGAQTVANAALGLSTLIPDSGNGTVAAPRNLSADGSRLFFTADGPLVARDTNGYSDVYEYSGGKLHLISTGTADSNSVFLDASVSGDDVFFATEQQLTSSDIDGARDVYDARVGGGFPEPPATAPCTGESCRPPLGGTSAAQSAASASFAGPGNATVDAATPVAKVKVTGRAVSGSRLKLTVKVPARGRVTVSGSSLKKAQKTTAKAGTYEVTVSLSAAGRRALERRHTLKLKARVAYAPDKGNASSTTVSVTIKSGGRR